MPPPDFPPTLVGPNITIRPISAGDWAALYAAGSDPEIWRVHPVPDRYSEAKFRSILTRLSNRKWALLLSTALPRA